MSLRATFATLVLAGALVPVPSLAFNLLSFDGRNVVAWRDNALPIEYEIQSSFAAVDGDTDVAAIHASFDAWEGATCSEVTFEFSGSTAGGVPVARDGRNRVLHTTSGFRSNDTSVLGVTYQEFSGDSFGWYLSGGDIALNAYVDWGTNGAANLVDVQSVVTHEVGHLIGLQHTPILAATMFYATAEGETQQRSLHEDDIAAACYLYPVGTFDCDSNADCPTLESNDTDQFGNPEVWGRTTCQPNGTCVIAGAPPGDPLGSTCAGPADCATSLCIPSPTEENNICSQPCTEEDAESCPEGFTCVDYGEDFGDVCVPNGDGQLGEPCEGGLDCASTLCVEVEPDVGACSEFCNIEQIDSCPAGTVCVESTEPGEAFCIPGGDTPFAGECEDSLDCEGSVCLVFEDGAETGLCSQYCNPNSPQPCPEGAACWPGVEEDEFFCVPGGDGEIGTACESNLDCQTALCVPYSDSDTDYHCGEPCTFRAGVNECSGGFVCFPFEVGGVCLPAGTEPLGASCETIFDCQSLLCLADDEVCTELCTGICPTGFECVDLEGGLGGCVSDGTVIPGDDTGMPDIGSPDLGPDVAPEVGEPDAGGSEEVGNPEEDASIGGEEDQGGGGGGGGGGSSEEEGCSVAGGGSSGLLLGLLMLGVARRRCRC